MGADPVNADKLSDARQRVADGRADEIVDVQYGIAPLSARRFVDLFDVCGLDDFFSTDLDDVTLAGRLSHMSTRGQRSSEGTGDHPGFSTLLLLSESDQHAPIARSGAGEYGIFGKRLAAACGGDSRCCVIPGADHAVSGAEASEVLITEVVGALR